MLKILSVIDPLSENQKWWDATWFGITKFVDNGINDSAWDNAISCLQNELDVVIGEMGDAILNQVCDNQKQKE